MRSDNIQFFLQKATFKFLKEKKTREKGGEGVLRRSKRRQHLPKIWTFLWEDRQTDRHCGS